MLAKGARDTVAFTWLFTALSVVIYLPVVLTVIIVTHPHPGTRAFLFMGISGSLHLCYYLLLSYGYRLGDLSLVYPIARGTGPVLATIGAIILLGERPTALAIAGGLTVVGGVLLMAAPRRLRGDRATSRAVRFALATGCFIATYTLWDKGGVALIAPVLYEWGTDFSRAVLFAPIAVRTAARRRAVVAEFRARPGAAVGVAVLSPLAYLMVLTALSVSRVSYVAPAREVGILIGGVLGARLLSEGDAARRLAGAAAIVAGIIALALG